MKWSKTDITEALGITVRRLNQLIKDGILPDPKKANARNVIRAYVSFIKRGNKELLAERTRLTKINADIKELMLQKERGELIETEKSKRLCGAVLMVIKNNLLSIPTKLSPMVMGCESLFEIKTIIETSIKEALTELSNPDLKEYRVAINKKEHQKEKADNMK